MDHQFAPVLTSSSPLSTRPRPQAEPAFDYSA
jgi:hypothetical protein